MIQVRPIQETDRPLVTRLLIERWGSVKIISRGKVHLADQLPGFVASLDGELGGVVTFHIDNNACEIVSMDSVIPNCGVGTSLLERIQQYAYEKSMRRIWLITTNDNLRAMQFYQRHGFVFAAVYADAIKNARVLKPEIPLIGLDGIPIRDEIEFEKIIKRNA